MNNRIDNQHIIDLFPKQLYSNTNIQICDNMEQYRKDLTHLNVYTIDPPKCIDADDGFSIEYKENGNITLYIHIADPTAYFNKYDTTFHNILHNCVTQYPCNSIPFHLFPKNILENSSLIYGKKRALTIQYDFINNIIKNKSLFFSHINCNPSYKFTYKDANQILNKKEIITAIHCAELLSNERNKKYKSLSELNLSQINYDFNNNVILEKPCQKEFILHSIIEEFAIATNSFIASLIQQMNEQYIFTRNCNDNGLQLSNTPQNMLANIVKDGIRASYDASAISHDIVGTKLYTHSTSPLRRVSDVIVHFILKDLIKGEISFTKEELDHFSQIINKKSREIKKIHLLDHKFQIYKYIHYLIQNNIKVQITFRFISYTGLFINLIFEKINEHNIYISVCLRCKPKHFNYNKKFVENQTYTFRCNTIHLPNNVFDSNVFPELEKLFILQN